MYDAEVAFTRENGEVVMTLRLNQQVILTSPSCESIVRELQLRGVRRLTVDQLFTTELPTSSHTLEQAGAIPFPELMPALRLIASCSAMAESATLPFSERRAKPRPLVADAASGELPTTDN